MKRYVDLGTQLDVDDEGPPQFAWYDTIVDLFETHDGEQTWTTWEAFESAYRSSGGSQLERYRGLFPKNVAA